MTKQAGKPLGNCKFCGTPLRAVGNARKNGKCHNDWISREYHKKCWAENPHLRIQQDYIKTKKYIQDHYYESESEESDCSF